MKVYIWMGVLNDVYHLEMQKCNLLLKVLKIAVKLKIMFAMHVTDIPLIAGSFTVYLNSIKQKYPCKVYIYCT